MGEQLRCKLLDRNYYLLVYEWKVLIIGFLSQFKKNRFARRIAFHTTYFVCIGIIEYYLQCEEFNVLNENRLFQSLLFMSQPFMLYIKFFMYQKSQFQDELSSYKYQSHVLELIESPSQLFPPIHSVLEWDRDPGIIIYTFLLSLSRSDSK